MCFITEAACKHLNGINEFWMHTVNIPLYGWPSRKISIVSQLAASHKVVGMYMIAAAANPENFKEGEMLQYQRRRRRHVPQKHTINYARFIREKATEKNWGRWGKRRPLPESATACYWYCVCGFL